MRKSRWLRHSVLVLVWLTIIFVASLALYNFRICQDWTFICENTASRKGYCEWCLGWKTNHWCKASALEQFMQERYPSELQHNWSCYGGIARNPLGMGIGCGSGVPGPIAVLNGDLLAEYIRKMDERQKKALYDLFASGNMDATDAKVTEINTQTAR